MQVITIESLSSVTGGADQPQLRTLARSYCPQTYQRFARTPTLTRRMGEQCLDEAGLSQHKDMLDRYFKK